MTASNELRELLGDLSAEVAQTDETGLFARLLRSRRARRRRVRLVAPARARDPRTIPMTAVVAAAPGRAAAWVAAGGVDPALLAAAPWRRCWGGCRRLVRDGYQYCCWTCLSAKDGGWRLGPWNPDGAWTDMHTQACESRHLAGSAAYSLAAAWRAAERRTTMTVKSRPGYHLCPVRVCPLQVPNRLLMCGQHWRMVPHEIQGAVYRAYRGGPLGSIDLVRAQSAAIQAVNDQYPK